MIRNSPVRTSNHPADKRAHAVADGPLAPDGAAAPARVAAKQAAHAAAREAPVRGAVLNRVLNRALSRVLRRVRNAVPPNGDVPRNPAAGAERPRAGANPHPLRNRV